jgi:predicted membrane protein
MENYNRAYELNEVKNNSGCFGNFGKYAGIFFGLSVTVAGCLLLAFNLEWIVSSFREVIFSWPMIFVFFMVVSLINRNYLSTLVFFVLSAFFLLPRIAKVYPDALPWIGADFAANYWPVLLLVLGICIILGLFFGKGSLILIFGNSGKNAMFSTTEGVEGKDGVYTRSVAFGGAEDVFLEPVFRGGKIEVAFGGVELDLRKTTLPEGDTHLKITVAFGGLEIRVPDSWKVVQEISTAFAGVEESRKIRVADIDESRRLIITGSVAFGGLEIS